MWSEFDVPKEDRICGNCKYWDTKFIRPLPIYNNTRFECTNDFAPCVLNSIDSDTCIMKGYHCKECENEGDFEACEEYWESRKQAADIEATYKDLDLYLRRDAAAGSW